MKVVRLVLVMLLSIMATAKLPGQTLKTIYSFTSTNGTSPFGALTLGNDGNFYGTTVGGGITNSEYFSGMGTIFKITPSGTFTLLDSFEGTNGANPLTGLTLGTDGNFYGTTERGGDTNLNEGYGFGTVFKLTTNGTLTTVVAFSGTNGAYPNSSITLGANGDFYGITGSGGIGPYSGNGTVFKLTTDRTLSVLAYFDNTNGSSPLAPLTLGNDGNLYGTTGSGGNLNLSDGYGYGTIFKVTPEGTLTTLFQFSGTNGSFPNAITLGKDGNFYGTTEEGGNTNVNGGQGDGTIFQVTTNGALTTLFAFSFTNGAFPEATVTLGNDGYFYGTTLDGGVTNSTNLSGMGTVFKISTNGDFFLLASFDGTNGANPIATVTLGSDGCYYGTTDPGGSRISISVSDTGTVFRLALPPVVPPTLTLQFLDGYPLLSIYGTLGDTYTIQCTTNIVAPNWTTMLIVPNLPMSPFQIIDPSASGHLSKFYRAVQSQ